MRPKKRTRCSRQPCTATSGAGARVTVAAGAATTVTGTEAAVTQIICKLVGAASLDPEDNFFLVGGHSLMGAQLIVRLREEFRIEIGLRQLFETPTVAGLAAQIDLLRSKAA